MHEDLTGWPPWPSPTRGTRYQDAVYDDAWLEASGVRRDVLSREPVEWDRPHDGDDPWSFYRWGRRTYAEVMGVPFGARELLA